MHRTLRQAAATDASTSQLKKWYENSKSKLHYVQEHKILGLIYVVNIRKYDCCVQGSRKLMYLFGCVRMISSKCNF